MGKPLETLDECLREFIAAQRVFFVATAPLAAGGHVNVSPKGLDTLRVLGDRRVAYVDHVGSGAETIAHVRENGRITLMWCAFDGPPKILRVHGTAVVHEPGDEAFAILLERFGPGLPPRAIIDVTADRIAESCGFGVPLMAFEGDRPNMAKWCATKDAEALQDYQRRKNARSLDGLPALRWTDEA